MDRRRTGVGYLILTEMLCALVPCGCAEFRAPRIDPTGQRIFAEPAPVYRDEPGPMASWDPVDLIVAPRATVAPVGSEVVLTAGVRGQDNYLITNERIHWTLDPGGVGEFVDIQPGSWCDFLVCDFTRPHKVDATYAVGSTSRKSVRLTRGTPSTEDDVCVLSGQTWISVTSPIEGTSLVTAFAPSVYGWEQRKQTAKIHWVDAQWRFPPPAINPAGTRHVFTTTVMRQTDQSACAGWRVRYQIAGGPAAGFAPSGAQSVEVETNALGQASAEIFQQRPAPGTNRVDIQIIRPAAPGVQQIMVGSGSTMKTWSSPGIAVRKTGPAVAGVGSTVCYRIQVSNPGDMAAENVAVVDEIPETMSLVGTNPPATPNGRTVQWNLGRLGPGGCQAMTVTLRADRPGSAAGCAHATASGGLKASECVTTTVAAVAAAVAAAPLGLRVTGPTQAAVGEQVAFEILISNPGDATYNDLVIKDRFDAGLQHASSASPIERKLKRLGPHETQPVKIIFRVVSAGQLCHTVELLENGALRATNRACLTAVAAGQPAIPPGAAWPSAEPAKPGQPAPGARPVSPPAVSVRITGPSLQNAGEEGEFRITVTNTGGQTLTNVKVFNEPAPEMLVTGTLPECQLQGENTAVWTINTLTVGRTQDFRVGYRFLKAAREACTRVSVTTSEGAKAEDRACLEIRPGRGAQAAPPSGAGLTLALTSLHNPTTEGKESTCEILVSNTGQTPASNVVLEVTVPSPQMTPVPLLTTGPAGLNLIEGQTVRFNALPLVNPGQSFSYRVRVLAKAAGEADLQARLTSSDLKQPVTGAVKITINSPKRQP